MVLLSKLEDVTLLDLVDLNNLQEIQDAFAEATGVGSVITDTDGQSLTRPSNFCQLCSLTRQTPQGRSRCERSDKTLGQKCLAAGGPVVQKCDSCGLYDASAPVIVNGRHIANWLIGQVKTPDVDRERIVAYAREISENPANLIEAFDRMPVMPPEQLDKTARLLWHMAKELSALGYRNLQMAVEIEKHKHVEAVLRHNIAQRKKTEEHLAYLSTHDSLTGLYNRSYFEQMMEQYEQSSEAVALLVCDVDGLKLINDTMGHTAGDALLRAAAAILSKVAGEQGGISRIGGDEFAILLPGWSREKAETIGNAIRIEAVHRNLGENELHLSLSIGVAAGDGSSGMRELFKEADNNMYREKLHRGQSARSAMVQTVMKLLEARDFITEGHADRMQSIVVRLGRAVGMPERRLADMRLLAQFHDIGKVGIPDRILFKPGLLTPEERMEMQRHSEIGHRIAQTSPDLSHIADWILKHHEWWNGQGYPLNLKEEEIPLECRILAVADAYDAMTSDRPYRSAMSGPAAVQELKAGAGVQFDPALVRVFTELLL